jgi:hypothetical protein
MPAMTSMLSGVSSMTRTVCDDARLDIRSPETRPFYCRIAPKISAVKSETGFYISRSLPNPLARMMVPDNGHRIGQTNVTGITKKRPAQKRRPEFREETSKKGNK